MKMIKCLAIPLFAALIIVSGCGNPSADEAQVPEESEASAPAASEPASEPTTDETQEPEPSDDSASGESKVPDTKEIIALVSQASELDNKLFEAKSPLTTEEVYAHYDSLFTRSYVDRIVLQEGNLKQTDEKWGYAHEGGEYLEGTFFNQLTEETAKIEVSENQQTITITNSVGDGLYAPHKEIITLISTETGWKVDNMKWEALK
jgi:hypothetical protein